MYSAHFGLTRVDCTIAIFQHFQFWTTLADTDNNNKDYAQFLQFYLHKKNLKYLLFTVKTLFLFMWPFMTNKSFVSISIRILCVMVFIPSNQFQVRVLVFLTFIFHRNTTTRTFLLVITPENQNQKC